MRSQTLDLTDARRDAVAASAEILGAKWTALLIYDLSGARRALEQRWVEQARRLHWSVRLAGQLPSRGSSTS